MRISLWCLFFCCLYLSPALAQQDSASLPTVTAFDCPQYPSLAKSARIVGIVQLDVATDGHTVADVKLRLGHPMLATDAITNLRSWKFADHKPTTFTVTYHYVNGKRKRDPVTKCDARMELPTNVTVSWQF